MTRHPPESPLIMPRIASILGARPRKWKWFRAAALLALAGLGAGCSGIRLSHSVSPLDFLLPGIMQNESPASGEELPVSGPDEQLAQGKDPLLANCARGRP